MAQDIVNVRKQCTLVQSKLHKIQNDIDTCKQAVECLETELHSSKQNPEFAISCKTIDQEHQQLQHSSPISCSIRLKQKDNFEAEIEMCEQNSQILEQNEQYLDNYKQENEKLKHGIELLLKSNDDLQHGVKCLEKMILKNQCEIQALQIEENTYSQNKMIKQSPSDNPYTAIRVKSFNYCNKYNNIIESEYNDSHKFEDNFNYKKEFNRVTLLLDSLLKDKADLRNKNEVLQKNVKQKLDRILELEHLIEQANKYRQNEMDIYQLCLRNIHKQIVNCNASNNSDFNSNWQIHQILHQKFDYFTFVAN